MVENKDQIPSETNEQLEKVQLFFSGIKDDESGEDSWTGPSGNRTPASSCDSSAGERGVWESPHLGGLKRLGVQV
jgi:hypothetical protein